jgi:hypothetical protein
VAAVNTEREDRVAAAGDLLDVVAGATDVPSALGALNEVLVSSYGLSVTSVVLTDRSWRAVTGAAEPDAVEATVIADWRRRTGPDRGSVPRERSLLVPVTVRRRVVGLARLSVALGEDPRAIDRSSARQVAAACSAIVRTSHLAGEVALARRSLADAVEQVDASSELRRTVDHLLDELDARLGGVGTGTDDLDWRARFDDLAGVVLRGRRDVHRMSHLPELLGAGRRRGLVAALRELGRRFERISATPVRLEVRGAPRPLPARDERALFRVACDALVSIDGLTRASIVVLVLTFGDDIVGLSIGDDGTGLAHRDPFGQPGLARLRRYADRVGAAVAVRNLRPHGVLVECTLPVGSDA